jgi:hypothetical protein
VVDLAILCGDDERLVDVRTDPPSGERRFGLQIKPRPHNVAVYGELGHARGPDDPVLRSAIQAAVQVISRESGLEADLDARAARCERNLVSVMTDQRIDVRLRGRDAFGFRSRHQIRSMIVPVDSAPPAHIVISAVV